MRACVEYVDGYAMLTAALYEMHTVVCVEYTNLVRVFPFNPLGC